MKIIEEGESLKVDKPDLDHDMSSILRRVL